MACFKLGNLSVLSSTSYWDVPKIKMSSAYAKKCLLRLASSLDLLNVSH